MTTISEFNHIQYLDSSNTPIAEYDVYPSDKLYNDFLGMMYAQSSGISSVTPFNMISSDSGLDKDTLNVLSRLSIFQSDLGNINNNKFYSILSGLSVMSLEVPTECVYLNIQDSKQSPKATILTINLSDYVTDVSSVNKLVFIINSEYSVSNLSPVIHQNSLNPHSNIFDKILTFTNYNDELSLPVVDSNFYNNQARVSLGSGSLELPIEIEPPLSILNDRLMIRNSEFDVIYGTLRITISGYESLDYLGTLELRSNPNSLSQSSGVEYMTIEIDPLIGSYVWDLTWLPYGSVFNCILRLVDESVTVKQITISTELNYVNFNI